MTSYLGLDACKGGWMATLISVSSCQIQFLKSLDDGQGFFYDAKLTLIDMPVGLEEHHAQRECDQLLRMELDARYRSSVFYSPIRDAVNASEYARASDMQFNKTGKRFSIQSWHLVPKIKELDRFLQVNTSVREKVYESHPEWCFKQLNGGAHPLNKKKTREGQEERLTLLKALHVGLGQEISSFFETSRKQGYAIDDVLDSVVLAVAAQHIDKYGAIYLPEFEKRDMVGHRMQVLGPRVYAK